MTSERLPLQAYLRNQRVVDAQLRRILLDAANSARRALAKVDPNSIRAAQLRLQEQQLRMWARIGNVIEDGIDGLLAEPGNRDDFAAKLRALLDDPTRAAAIATHAFAKVTSRFSAERMTREVEALYERYLR